MSDAIDARIISGQNQEISRLRAEIAALREPMACTHPRACWREPSSVHPDGHCSMCVEKRLAVTAALREAAQLIYDRSGSYDRDAILALLSDSDHSALDAHDADTRNRALEEAAHEVRHTCGQNDSAMTSHTEDCRRCRILALIPPGKTKVSLQYRELKQEEYESKKA